MMCYRNRSSPSAIDRPARRVPGPRSRLGTQVDRGLKLVSARLARPDMPHASLADMLGPFGSDERVAALRAREQMRAVGFHCISSIYIAGIEHRCSLPGTVADRGTRGTRPQPAVVPVADALRLLDQFGSLAGAGPWGPCAPPTCLACSASRTQAWARSSNRALWVWVLACSAMRRQSATWSRKSTGLLTGLPPVNSVHPGFEYHRNCGDSRSQARLTWCWLRFGKGGDFCSSNSMRRGDCRGLRCSGHVAGTVSLRKPADTWRKLGDRKRRGRKWNGRKGEGRAHGLRLGFAGCGEADAGGRCRTRR